MSIKQLFKSKPFFKGEWIPIYCEDAKRLEDIEEALRIYNKLQGVSVYLTSVAESVVKDIETMTGSKI